MKGIYIAILISTLFIVGTYIFLLFLGPENAHIGLEHRIYSSMLESNQSSQPEPSDFAGLIFALSGFVVLVAGLGIPKSEAKAGIGRMIVLGLAGYFIIFILLFLSYQAEKSGNVEPLILGLPASTSIMIFGLWFYPLVFVVVYVWKFNDWIYPLKSQKIFEEIKNHSSNYQQNLER